VFVDAEGCRLRDRVDGVLEAVVTERLDSAAVVANEVVMMVPAGLGPLVPCSTRPEVDPVDEPELRERLEGPIDARDPDGRPLLPNLCMDVGDREATALGGHGIDDRDPGPTGPEPGPAKRYPRVLAPGHARMISVLILM
jgi:hypothetical protein